MATLEDGYGINLIPLATFAMEAYKDDPCPEFMPKSTFGNDLSDKLRGLNAQMHKAISIIQFKLEGQLYEKYHSWNMRDRELLKAIDYGEGTCDIEGKTYRMTSCHFPTIDPSNPNSLTKEEKLVIDKLCHSFLISEKLQNHIKALLVHGCMYRIVNNNLLFHASVPLNADGSLKEVEIAPGRRYKGKELFHNIGMLIRTAFANDANEEESDYARDFFLYLWCGPDSPLFDKSKMATFERYFIREKETHDEKKGNYFLLRDNENVVDSIMDAFGMKGNNRHIINGHVPVRAVKGESPIKADGKLMVIDGGFSRAYHKDTGIAGYTLIYHSRGFQLVQHEPFTSAEEAIRNGTDIKGTTQIVEFNQRRLRVADTDKGDELRKQIADLEELLYAYRHGIITEKEQKKDK